MIQRDFQAKWSFYHRQANYISRFAWLNAAGGLDLIL